MNDFFNLKRFGAYAARDYRSHWKKYAIIAGALLGVLVLVFTFQRVVTGSAVDGEHIRNLTGLNFGFIMAACAVFFTISVMKPMKSRHTLAVESTVPASLFEKYLFTLLNTTVVFSTGFLFIYLLAALYSWGVLGGGTLGDYFYYRGEMISRLLFWLVVPLQAATMFAGTMERRRHMVSLLMVGAAVFAGILIFGLPELISARLHTAVSYGFGAFANAATAGAGDVRLTYALSGVGGLRPDGPEISTALAVLGMLLFWTAAWFNFKERSAK